MSLDDQEFNKRLNPKFWVIWDDDAFLPIDFVEGSYENAEARAVEFVSSDDGDISFHSGGEPNIGDLEIYPQGEILSKGRHGPDYQLINKALQANSANEARMIWGMGV